MVEKVQTHTQEQSILKAHEVNFVADRLYRQLAIIESDYEATVTASNQGNSNSGNTTAEECEYVKIEEEAISTSRLTSAGDEAPPTPEPTSSGDEAPPPPEPTSAGEEATPPPEPTSAGDEAPPPPEPTHIVDVPRPESIPLSNETISKITEAMKTFGDPKRPDWAKGLSDDAWMASLLTNISSRRSVGALKTINEIHLKKKK
eukprot:985939_1